MTEVVRADVAQLDDFTDAVLATFTGIDAAVDGYGRAVAAFLAAPNDFAGLFDGRTAPLPDRSGSVDTALDGLRRVDRRPSVYADMLRQLDADGDGALSALEAPSRRFLDLYVQYGLDHPGATPEELVEGALAGIQADAQPYIDAIHDAVENPERLEEAILDLPPDIDPYVAAAIFNSLDRDDLDAIAFDLHLNYQNGQRPDDVTEEVVSRL